MHQCRLASGPGLDVSASLLASSLKLQTWQLTRKLQQIKDFAAYSYAAVTFSETTALSYMREWALREHLEYHPTWQLS